MIVDVLLKAKGRAVEMIGPNASVASAVGRMDRLGIGSLVVSADGVSIEGILSERDVVSGLAAYGTGLLDLRVGDVMSTPVTTCTPMTSIHELMATMTAERRRHVPVTEGGCLAGVVSIGDVVKARLEELEAEARLLREYIGAR